MARNAGVPRRCDLCTLLCTSFCAPACLLSFIRSEAGTSALAASLQADFKWAQSFSAHPANELPKMMTLLCTPAALSRAPMSEERSRGVKEEKAAEESPCPLGSSTSTRCPCKQPQAGACMCFPVQALSGFPQASLSLARITQRPGPVRQGPALCLKWACGERMKQCPGASHPRRTLCWSRSVFSKTQLCSQAGARGEGKRGKGKQQMDEPGQVLLTWAWSLGPRNL